MRGLRVAIVGLFASVAWIVVSLYLMASYEHQYVAMKNPDFRDETGAMPTLLDRRRIARLTNDWFTSAAVAACCTAGFGTAALATRRGARARQPGQGFDVIQ